MSAARPDLGSERRLRRLATLELVNGLALLGLAILVSALSFSPAVSITLAAVFLACGASAFWLRRRFWSELELERGRRRQAEQEARDADGAKGRFLASLGHEIRTPMNGILGLSELLLYSGLPPPQQEQVELVRTSAEALLALADDILDLARIDAGRFQLAPATGAAPAPAPMPDERRRRARGSRRILVVDDRAANRSVAQVLLLEAGYESVTAASGEQALELLAGQRFDAVLLDREMPGLDGDETCRRLRRREGSGRRTPVIAVTAHTQPEVREACRAAGMDGYLAKPFRTAELAAVLDHWTGIDAGDGLEERLAALRELPAGDGPDMGTQVIAEFLRQGENDLATMRRALQQRDGATLADTAHGLSGSAALLGARDLAESASELATLARGGDLAACTAWLPRVEREYQDAARRMR